jgi:hypothetical protein
VGPANPTAMINFGAGYAANDKQSNPFAPDTLA